MSSPEREKQSKALERFNAFCLKLEKHNDKIRLIELIIKRLYKLDFRELKLMLIYVRDKAKKWMN